MKGFSSFSLHVRQYLGYPIIVEIFVFCTFLVGRNVNVMERQLMVQAITGQTWFTDLLQCYT